MRRDLPPDYIRYTIVLTEGEHAWIEMPEALTAKQARRIVRFVESLVVPDDWGRAIQNQLDRPIETSAKEEKT